MKTPEEAGVDVAVIDEDVNERAWLMMNADDRAKVVAAISHHHRKMADAAGWVASPTTVSLNVRGGARIRTHLVARR